jgi:hypothetical protein
MGSGREERVESMPGIDPPPELRDLVDSFFRAVEEKFRFLVIEHGFCAPVFTWEAEVWCAKVRYFASNNVIEVILDTRERWIECKVARVIDGQAAPQFEVNDHGERVRETITSLLRERGIAPQFTNRCSASFADSMQVWLEDLARMLREHAADVLADSPRVLDPSPPSTNPARGLGPLERRAARRARTDGS